MLPGLERGGSGSGEDAVELGWCGSTSVARWVGACGDPGPVVQSALRIASVRLSACEAPELLRDEPLWSATMGSKVNPSAGMRRSSACTQAPEHMVRERR